MLRLGPDGHGIVLCEALLMQGRYGVPIGQFADEATNRERA